jgi:hypothetical protein
MPKLTHGRLLEVMNYDPQTGFLTWIKPPSNSLRVGDRAGGLGTNGRRFIMIDGEKHQAHRLARFYVSGEWPKGDVRQKNGDYDDCSLDNLIEVSRVGSAYRRGRTSENSSGFRGVSPSTKHGKWQAAITWNYKQCSLGANFETPEEASEVYEAICEKLSAAKSEKERDAIMADALVAKRKRAVWKNLNRFNSVLGWKNFEQFCGDVTGIPKTRYAMAPIDPERPIGPGNFKWSLPVDSEVSTRDGLVAYHRANFEANSSYHRHKHLKKEYGADIGYERKLLVEQEGKCAICRKPEELTRNSGQRRLSLDHDHDTKALRGLLCGNCNHGLGYFDHNPDHLRAAADYIGHYRLA